VRIAYKEALWRFDGSEEENDDLRHGEYLPEIAGRVNTANAKNTTLTVCTQALAITSC
jgi:hypothetical protein